MRRRGWRPRNVAVEEYDVHLVVVDVDKVRIERWRK